MNIDHLIKLGRVDPILETDANGIDMLTGWRRKDNPRSRKVHLHHEWKLRHPQAWIQRDAIRAGHAHTPGVQIILDERRRQVLFEKFDAEHDDKLTDGQLARAAQCYEWEATGRKMHVVDGREIPVTWFLDPAMWKPGDRIRELAKAGALYFAEHDRMKRAGDADKASLVAHQAIGCASGIDNIYKVTPLSPGPHMLGAE